MRGPRSTIRFRSTAVARSDVPTSRSGHRRFARTNLRRPDGRDDLVHLRIGRVRPDLKAQHLVVLEVAAPVPDSRCACCAGTGIARASCRERTSTVLHLPNPKLVGSTPTPREALLGIAALGRHLNLSTFANLARLGFREQVKRLSVAPDDSGAFSLPSLTLSPTRSNNLSGQSSLGLSFEQPVETMESISIATLNILEAFRFTKRKIRFTMRDRASASGTRMATLPTIARRSGRGARTQSRRRQGGGALRGRELPRVAGRDEQQPRHAVRKKVRVKTRSCSASSRRATASRGYGLQCDAADRRLRRHEGARLAGVVKKWRMKGAARDSSTAHEHHRHVGAIG